MKGIEQGCHKGYGGVSSRRWFFLDSSSFGSCSPSLAQDADKAMSASSWTFSAKWKERDWWSADLEGEMEKLEVEGGFSGTEGGSVDPKGKVGQSARIKNHKRKK